DCYKLKLRSDIPKWELFNSDQIPSLNVQLAEVNNNFYAIGGYIKPHMLRRVSEFDKITEQWAPKSSLPRPLSMHCVVVLNAEIWIIGGLSENMTLVRQTTIYNPATDSFRTPGITGELNVARYNLVCGVIKDPKTNHDWVLVMGGRALGSFASMRTIEYFDVQENQEWKILTTQVPFYETNATLALGGGSGGGFIKFGPSRYMLILGSTTDQNMSNSNLVMWNKDIGQFHHIISAKLQNERYMASVVQIPLHTRWTCLPMGNDWVKMVEQNTDHFFQPLQLTGYANTEDTIISNLDTLELYKSCNDFYHLRLVWPELGYFNEWRQKSNFINPGPVLDYQAIAVRYPNFFGGLIHVNDNAQPDGHPDDTYFKGDTRTFGTFGQYAVGRYSNGPDNRMPGPVGNEGTGDIPISVDKLIL
ncbi:hypothetical protein TCAL_13880, partial [Tigriopus californicus]